MSCPMPRQFAVIAAAILGAVFAAAPAFAIDMPARKAGLWELKMEFEGRQMPAQVMKQCVDAASDKIMNSNFGGSAQEACSLGWSTGISGPSSCRRAGSTLMRSGLGVSFSSGL